jgi:hypothetical protein
MLFDPMAFHAYPHKLDKQHRDSSDYEGLTIYQMALWGNAQPFAAAIAFEEIGKTISFDGIRKFFRHLFLSDPDPTEVRSHYEDRLGIRVPLSDEEFDAMMTEVKRFKWLEAEKAGRDIWRERCPDDPEGGALREWFNKHFGAWYLSRHGNGHYVTR